MSEKYVKAAFLDIRIFAVYANMQIITIFSNLEKSDTYWFFGRL